MAKVSIIIPLYNKADYIRATIDSVLGQKYSDYELIVVDDGSTDNSLRIAESYMDIDARLKVIAIQNGGVSHARNVGLDNARGDWIQFLDADDLIDPDYLHDIFEKRNADDADIIFTSFHMIDAAGGFLKSVDAPYSGLADQAMLCEKFIETQYKTGFFGFISNKLFTRDLLLRSGSRFAEDLTLAEDLDFYSRLYPFVNKARFENIRSFLYLQDNSNYINEKHIDYYKQLRIQMNIRTWFEKSGLIVKYADILDRKISDYVFFTIFYGFEEKGVLSDEYDMMQENQRIKACVRPALVHGFEACILHAFLMDHRFAVNAMLSGRDAVRRIYRRFHGR